MQSINLIARDNGAGITRDLQLLADVLRGAGYQVSITGLGHRGRLSNRFRRLRERLRRLARGWLDGQLNARYDINLFIEQLRPEYCEQARLNVLLPNPEWFHAEWIEFLPRMDLVLAKTRHAEHLFGELGCRTRHVGFAGEDCLDPSQPRQPDFFHGPGRSGNKGTLPLLELWARHPEWPKLTVVWRRKRVELPALPANVVIHRDYLEQTHLRRLQNSSHFHLCPSQTEGYGHSLIEAMSCAAVTVATDGEPMNELIQPDRGVLVAAHRGPHQALATLYDFDASAMEAAVQRCIEMTETERQALGQHARAWYELACEQFPPRLLAALAELLAEHPGPASP
ncbi:glycosyltransferase [Frateuria aurantia]